jgi:hypothetical protein
MAELRDPERERYESKLLALPPSGGGGCHTALLGCATVGVRAGVKPERIFADLREHVHGNRDVPDREILEAVNKAVADGANPVKQVHRTAAKKDFDAAAAMLHLIEKGRGCQSQDLSDRSPVRIDWPPEMDAWHTLEALYGRDERLYIGPAQGAVRLGLEIRPAADWINILRKSPAAMPHIIPNPLTGETAELASGKGNTLRGDGCVARFRFAVVEFDSLSREDQLAFWWSARLPVALLVDSGGKSIHGWIRVENIDSGGQWARVIEQYLFGQLLQPLGVDGACRNESRLSRMPGHYRKEKGNWQRLLYLAPEGKAVAA